LGAGSEGAEVHDPAPGATQGTRPPQSAQQAGRQGHADGLRHPPLRPALLVPEHPPAGDAQRAPRGNHERRAGHRLRGLYWSPAGQVRHNGGAHASRKDDALPGGREASGPTLRQTSPSRTPVPGVQGAGGAETHADCGLRMPSSTQKTFAGGSGTGAGTPGDAGEQGHATGDAGLRPEVAAASWET